MIKLISRAKIESALPMQFDRIVGQAMFGARMDSKFDDLAWILLRLNPDNPNAVTDFADECNTVSDIIVAQITSGELTTPNRAAMRETLQQLFDEKSASQEASVALFAKIDATPKTKVIPDNIWNFHDVVVRTFIEVISSIP